jgi:xanthine dehydrogenase YagS FAD-binding subunit
VSVAVGLHVEGGTVKAARVCFGAVAPIPVRDGAAEAALTGKPLGPESIAAAAAAALAGAKPLEQNGYKLPVARGLLRRALERLA